MSHDPWRRSASPDQLRALFDAQVLSRSVAERALEIATRPPEVTLWAALLRVGLLVVGSTLTLAGILFFFAWNWADLGRFEKLGVVAMAVVLTAAFAWSRVPSLAGNVALFAACVLEGALLAVYGQAYQTGADPYELFTAWMVVILPWVLAARTPAFFALELLLANVAVSLYWVQVLQSWSSREPVLMLVLFALNGAALAAWQVFVRRFRSEDDARWFTRTVAAAALAMVVPPAVSAVVDARAGVAHVAALALVVAAAVAAGLFFARGARQDLFVCAAAWSAALVVLDALLGRVAFVDLRLNIFGFFAMGALVLAEVGALVKLLRSLAREGAPEVA